MIQNDSKRFKTIPNDSKWIKTIQTDSNRFKMIQNDSIRFKMTQNNSKQNVSKWDIFCRFLNTVVNDANDWV